MKPFLLGTNWKMNKTESEAIAYTNSLIKMAQQYDHFRFFIFPPFVYIKELSAMLATQENVLIGAQNMHWEDFGPYTGEISPLMLAQYNIDVIELGHSERRQYYNENDYHLNKKVLAAIKQDFTPLLCIGESLDDKQYDVTREVLNAQVKIGLHGVSPSAAKNIWIAYEPVWAIGEGGIPATADYVARAHSFIREQLIELYGEEVGEAIRILYGGSVNAHNCVELSKQKNVDGLFIGRSAWDIIKFQEIAQLLSDPV